MIAFLQSLAKAKGGEKRTQVCLSLSSFGTTFFFFHIAIISQRIDHNIVRGSLTIHKVISYQKAYKHHTNRDAWSIYLKYKQILHFYCDNQRLVLLPTNPLAVQCLTIISTGPHHFSVARRAISQDCHPFLTLRL